MGDTLPQSTGGRLSDRNSSVGRGGGRGGSWQFSGGSNSAHGAGGHHRGGRSGNQNSSRGRGFPRRFNGRQNASPKLQYRPKNPIEGGNFHNVGDGGSAKSDSIVGSGSVFEIERGQLLPNLGTQNSPRGRGFPWRFNGHQNALPKQEYRPKNPIEGGNLRNVGDGGSAKSNSIVGSGSVLENESGQSPPNLGTQDIVVGVMGSAEDEVKIEPLKDVLQLRSLCDSENQTSQEAGSDSRISNSEDLRRAEQPELIKPFDICLPKIGTPIMLKPSLLQRNRDRRNENNRAVKGSKGEILGSGMVLLEKYLSIEDQVKIIKQCQELGLGHGGFYQPGYRDGGRLHLKMMCLGKHWEPETSMYCERRSFDNAQPPIIPCELRELVKKAIGDSNALLEENFKASRVEDILPLMSPDICIVNFYSETGRLGLHQDKDESKESLEKGLPVVSFSLGDSADFLYSNHRDVEQAEKIKLESGDVLIFGGKSRHVFHGVSSIHKGTAPQSLLRETNLRPGRLNLTFRQY